MGLFVSRSSYSMLVVRSFEISEDPSSQTPIKIEGRAPGLISWLLTLLRLRPEVFLVLSPKGLTFHSASLSGVSRSFIPLPCIASTSCGYRRPIWALILAVICVGWGLVSLLGPLFALPFSSGSEGGILFAAGLGGLLAWLLVGAIFGLVYYLWKRIAITIETSGGNHFGLLFQPSLIEGKSIDLPEALRAIAILNARVLTASSIQSVSGSGSQPHPLVGKATRCPQCSTDNPAGGHFCESCGSALS